MLQRVLFRIGISVALAFVALVTWLLWAFHYALDTEAERFEAHKWKERAGVYSVNNDPGCVRGGMALDLLKQKLLLGKALAEVYVLLGPPDKAENSSITYELGQCYGFGLYDTILIVGFDENKKVTQTNIKRDPP